MSAKTPVLEVQDLAVDFDTDDGALTAVDHVSFHVNQGEVAGLVGESGCGKSVTALALLRLVPRPPGRLVSGRVLYKGEDVLSCSPERLRQIRGNGIGMIFQEPGLALSPLHRVGDQLVEVQLVHKTAGRKKARETAVEWLRKMGIPNPEEMARAFPHELSGGMKQRVMIAMALLMDPGLIVADEPTTALDVTISAQIFDLIRAMRRENTAVLLITHDLGVVWEMCSRVLVMYAGKIVEEAGRDAFFARPLHPYSQGLLRSVPRLGEETGELFSIEGAVPSPLAYPPGCRFHPRCPLAVDRCRSEMPELEDLGGGRRAACFLARRPE
jgi:oligopeptide/dipeptide ABC transporter ATP-binding protein